MYGRGSAPPARAHRGAQARRAPRGAPASPGPKSTARFADVGVRRKHLPGALFGLVVLAVMQRLEREAVHVEVDERRLDVDRVQVFRHERDAGALLHYGIALFAYAGIDAVVEAVQLLARDADDHRPGGVVVRRRAVITVGRIYIQREAMVRILGDPVKARIALGSGLRRRVVRGGEEVLPR